MDKKIEIETYFKNGAGEVWDKACTMNWTEANKIATTYIKQALRLEGLIDEPEIGTLSKLPMEEDESWEEDEPEVVDKDEEIRNLKSLFCSEIEHLVREEVLAGLNKDEIDSIKNTFRILNEHGASNITISCFGIELSKQDIGYCYPDCI